MRTVALTLALALVGTPALAQDRPPQGIAFAQAENGTWLCRHEAPEEALACAHEQCAEQASGECFPIAWCFPSGWSGEMLVQLPGLQGTHVLCGIPTETALKAAFAALCANEAAATRCDLVKTIDPEGNERTVEGESFAGPVTEPEAGAAQPAEAGAAEEPPAQE
jgi:hypothetical protein